MKTRVSKISNVIFFLTFSLAMASCNKEDFYQKEYLQDPNQNPTTTGSVDNGSNGGVDSGNTQGGVDSGTNGGTTGGATGSSTAGTDGSATGGTNGGVDGSTTSGGATGSSTAGTDGSATGGTNGGVDGSTTSGSTTGGTTGSTTGSTTGGTTGGTTGSTTGGTTGGTTGSTTGGSTTGGTTGGSTGDCNNGHGNDADGVDESNPTIGTETKCKKEIFKQSSAVTKKLDIVWIIDDSGSMADEQTALGTNFSAFINDFITKDVDFKMAITTTDTSSSTRKGRMVTGSDVKLTSAKAKENEAQFKSDFRSLVKVGTSGSGYEKGLEASEGFMQKYASTFLRPDAYLAVVVISDEEDQSSKTVAQYTDYLKSFKSEAGLVKVYSIVDVGLSNANGGSGISAGYKRYKEASDNTAGTVADIRDDFYRTLEDMGETIINLLDSFALANAADPASIHVYVNGVETTGFTYDATSHSIKFNQNNIPAVGSSIEVRYAKL